MYNSQSKYFSLLSFMLTFAFMLPAHSEDYTKIYPGTNCNSSNNLVKNASFTDNAIRNTTKHALDEGDDQIGFASVNCPVSRDSITKKIKYTRLTVSAGSDDLLYGTVYCRFFSVAKDNSWTFSSSRTVNSILGGATGEGLHDLTFGTIPNQAQASYMFRCDLPPTLPGKASPAVYSYQVNEAD